LIETGEIKDLTPCAWGPRNRRICWRH